MNTTPRRQGLRRIGNAFVGLMIGTGFVLLVTDVSRQGEVLNAIRSSQQDRAPVIDSTHQAAQSSASSLQLLESCLVPGRPCNVRSAKNQRAVLRQVADHAVYVAVCEHTSSVATVPELRRCVHQQARLDKRH